jgi:hypothetical protein
MDEFIEEKYAIIFHSTSKKLLTQILTVQYFKKNYVNLHPELIIFKLK